jgi:hypothetical protein
LESDFQAFFVALEQDRVVRTVDLALLMLREALRLRQAICER